jgi:hypothetical protein
MSIRKLSVGQTAVRSRAKQRGYLVTRCRHVYPLNLDQFALIRSTDNEVVLGKHYEATLEQIAAFLETAPDLGPVFTERLYPIHRRRMTC